MQLSAEGGIAVKELEFMELLGDLPAEYIDAASNPRQKKRRFAWLRYGVPAMAACIAIVILAAVYPRLKSPAIPSVETEPAVTEITAAGASEAENLTTAAPETDENGIIQNPPHMQTDKHTETHTKTESEAENETGHEDSGTEQEGQSGTHHADPDTPHAETEKTKPHVTTSPKNSVTKQTTKATTKSQADGTTRVTTKIAAVTTRATTKAPAKTTARLTTKAPVRTTVATRKTTPTTTVPKPVMTTGAAAITVPTTHPMQGVGTDAPKQPDYTKPYYTEPNGTAGPGTNEPPIEGTDEPEGPDVPTVPDIGELPRELIKWQTYNPDARSDDLDVWYEIASGYPGGDEYRQLEDFDFDNYNCLIIHLRTHATDADLTEISLDGRSVQISGMIYRQEYDPTQRHFMFAFAIPKYMDWLDHDPEYNWDLTGDASNFYTTTEGEPYFWIY